MKPEDKQEAPDTGEPATDDNPAAEQTRPKEVGGRGGLDPTRYGDWEKNGRCVDF